MFPSTSCLPLSSHAKKKKRPLACKVLGNPKPLAVFPLQNGLSKAFFCKLDLLNNGRLLEKPLVLPLSAFSSQQFQH